MADPASNQDDIAIHVDGLWHQYPNATDAALDHVRFSVRRGELFGILGPNGSGKSTLFRILSTLLRPGSGTAAVMGHDVLTGQALVRQRLGVVFQSPSLDDQLTAIENLRYHGRLHGLTSKAIGEGADRWLRHFELNDRRDEPVGRFSGGMRRRLELAKALLHEPDVLLMDEPATGLDPRARRELRDRLSSLRDETGMTVVFTTHLMDEAEACDRLAILAGGKLIALDTPANLKSGIGGDVITLEPEQPGDLQSLADQITERFGPWEDGAAPALIDGRIHFEKTDGPRIIADIAAAFPEQVRSLTVGRPTLEDVYLHLTGDSIYQHAGTEVDLA